MCAIFGKRNKQTNGKTFVNVKSRNEVQFVTLSRVRFPPSAPEKRLANRQVFLFKKIKATMSEKKSFIFNNFSIVT